MITGNLVPAHATIARKAGLVGSGVVSIDGCRISGNANPDVNVRVGQITREIVAETKATDEAEDELCGDQRGDEFPAELRTPEGRREFFRQAPEQLRREQEKKDSERVEEPTARAGSGCYWGPSGCTLTSSSSVVRTRRMRLIGRRGQ